MLTSATTPARICILGEGTSRIQGRGITAAISPLATTVTINDDTAFSVSYAPPFDTVAPTLNCISGVIRAYEKRGNKVSAASYRVSSSIPPGQGLSSSAALCVAAAACINNHFNFGYAAAHIAEVAFEGETVELGATCGRMDHYATCIRGVQYQDYSAFPIRIESIQLPQDTVIVVGHTGRGSLYATVGNTILSRYDARDPLLLRYRELIIETALRLRTLFLQSPAPLSEIGALITSVHTAIRSLLLIENPEIDAYVRMAIDQGAYASKTCGTRREGGSVYALCMPDSAARVSRAWRDQGLSTTLATVAL